MMISGLSDQVVSDQIINQFSGSVTKSTIQDDKEQDNKSTTSTFYGRDVSGCMGKSWIGCYFTDDKATRDKYEDDYCIFCCCLRFGCFSSAGSSVEEAVVSVEINEDHNLQSTSEKKVLSLGDQIEQLESSWLKSDRDWAEDLKKVRDFGKPEVKEPVSGESAAWSVVPTILNLGTMGLTPEDKDPQKNKPVIYQDAFEEMRDRDYQRKVRAEKNQYAQFQTAVNTVVPSLMPSVHSSGGGGAGHGKTRTANFGSLFEESGVVTGIAVTHLDGRKKKDDDSDKARNKDSIGNNSRSGRRSANTNSAMKTVRSVFSGK